MQETSSERIAEAAAAYIMAHIKQYYCIDSILKEHGSCEEELRTIIEDALADLLE